METSIFIRTYAADILWLNFCLQSLRKYAHGHREIVVATPDYKKIRANCDVRKCTLVEVPRYHADDYIGQQITKLEADRYCAGAECILFWDSDTIAHRNFNMAEFFADNGKPIHTFREWENAGTAVCWRDVTAKVVGFDPPFEYMPQMPVIHRAEVLNGFRCYIEQVSGQAFHGAMAGAKALSEYNALGAYADRFQRDAYAWREAGPNDGFPRPAKQFWSKGPRTPEIESEINRFLA